MQTPVIVATPEGVTTARTVRRIPEEKRWGEESLKWVKWAPWYRYKDAKDADGEVPEGVPEEEEEAEKDKKRKGTSSIY